MTTRLLAAVAALAAGGFAARAADDENPYKKSNVGDFATYTMKVTLGSLTLEGATTCVVTAKTDKEVTVKVSSSVSGTEVPAQEQKIDLTKPYDPTRLGPLPPGTDVKVEKGQTGGEKLKIAGKDYATTWTAYKVKGKANNADLEADVKVWHSDAAPLGMVRLQMTASVAKMQVDMTMELSKSGNTTVKQ